MAATTDRVECRTPTPGKAPTRIEKWKFDAVRKAILASLPRRGGGAPFSDLPKLVKAALPTDQLARLGVVKWYVTTVKLELEVRGEIRRTGAVPQRLLRSRAAAGTTREIRRSKPAKSSSAKPGGRSTTTEPATQGAFEDILSAAKPELQPICKALRDSIASFDRNHVEVVWPRQRIASYGVGPKKMTEHYAYVMVHGGHVNLGFYRGAHLPDPGKLLAGTGKNLRHIKIHSVNVAKAPGVAALLRAAIAERKNALGR